MGNEQPVGGVNLYPVPGRAIPSVEKGARGQSVDSIRKAISIRGIDAE